MFVLIAMFFVYHIILIYIYNSFCYYNSCPPRLFASGYFNLYWFFIPLFGVETSPSKQKIMTIGLVVPELLYYSHGRGGPGYSYATFLTPQIYSEKYTGQRPLSSRVLTLTQLTLTRLTLP
jgi:hypothetical protein